MGYGAGGHRDLRSLQRLFEAQDGRRLGQLVRGMAGLKGGEAVFEVWMKQQSDTVQVSRAKMCPKAPEHRAASQACAQVRHRSVMNSCWAGIAS